MRKNGEISPKVKKSVKFFCLKNGKFSLKNWLFAIAFRYPYNINLNQYFLCKTNNSICIKESS